MSWNQIEMDVIRWSEERGIIPNSTSVAQYRKAQEEMHELHTALINRNRADIIDGLGDVLVCLINVAALENVDLTHCLLTAYNEIKDRKGHMNAGGIFVKEPQSPDL
ncbi:NTP pyrophosphohydrolase MazG, putative catalytic core [uncultured Caudovirales phage]|uniref:NTP pyrophosphohydrolase MazG, putative catalytic core n=1 Tax=uncultured Caudovirales phage TaxID=2100421 RepID=A0A6J7WFE2_9CAUD|nr:NTP pyrophosphohydrolase MazG, putative catalytic core [uncultured Caudovirales phage]